MKSSSWTSSLIRTGIWEGKNAGLERLSFGFGTKVKYNYRIIIRLSRPGVGKLFPVEAKMVNIFRFGGHAVFVATPLPL